MNGALLVGVAYEFPSVVVGLLCDARVIFADAGIDRQRGTNLQTLEQIEEAPHADPHAVFVPAPVRHVGNEGLSRRRSENLPRHWLADVPYFEIDDAPEYEPAVIRQLERPTVHDGRKCSAFARQHRPAAFFRYASFHGKLCFPRSPLRAGQNHMPMRILRTTLRQFTAPAVARSQPC